jgi:uncharacterized protein
MGGNNMKRLLLTIIFLLAATHVFGQTQKVDILSEDVELNAYFYHPHGDDLKPTLIWLHGNPGGKEEGKSNFAKELNELGINVLRFNYRGLWGTEGVFRMGNSLIDLDNVLDFVFLPQTVSTFKIDTHRVIVGGYSYGSNLAILSALNNERVKDIICLGLADHNHFYFTPESLIPNTNEKSREFNQIVKDSLWGPSLFIKKMDEENFHADILVNTYKYDFVAQTEKLLDNRILFIVGLNDLSVPIENHFFPVYRELKRLGHQNFQVVLRESDHSFKDFLIEERAELISNWIKKRVNVLLPGRVGSADPEAERKVLLETDQAWASAIAEGDMESVFSYWADYAVIIPAGMETVRGKEAIRNFIATNRAERGFSLRTEPLEATVSQSGDIGYTVGNYEISMDGPDETRFLSQGRYLATWQKDETGAWKCTMEIHSPLSGISDTDLRPFHRSPDGSPRTVRGDEVAGTLTPVGSPVVPPVRIDTGESCIVELQQVYVISGALSGSVEIDYRILVAGPCESPPGAFDEEWIAHGIFTGTVNEAPSSAIFSYTAQIKAGGEVEGRIVLGQGLGGELSIHGNFSNGWLSYRGWLNPG